MEGKRGEKKRRWRAGRREGEEYLGGVGERGIGPEGVDAKREEPMAQNGWGFF